MMVFVIEAIFMRFVERLVGEKEIGEETTKAENLPNMRK